MFYIKGGSGRGGKGGGMGNYELSFFFWIFQYIEPIFRCFVLRFLLVFPTCVFRMACPCRALTRSDVQCVHPVSTTTSCLVQRSLLLCRARALWISFKKLYCQRRNQEKNVWCRVGHIICGGAHRASTLQHTATHVG